MVSGVGRTRKIMVRAALAAGLLFAGAALACLDLVDHRPYFRQPFHRETLERLRAVTATNGPVRGLFFAGFGRARLTPEINVSDDRPEEGRFRSIPLAGYGDRRGRPAEGVNDDLFVKAVAVRAGGLTGILFAADALIVPREVADAVSRQLAEEAGLRREQLYFSATHTHCSIGAWGEGFAGEAFAGPFQSGSRTWFASRLVLAAREALADLQPAEFGRGVFEEPRFVRNRLVKELGTVDSDFAFLVIRQAGGGSAVLGSYAAHATVLSGRVMEFSGDYPGFWQRELERAGFQHALFLAGSVGSHGPVPGESGFSGAETMGRHLAEALIKNFKDVSFTNTVTLGITGLDVSLPELQVRISDSWRLRPWFSRRLLRVPADRTFLQVFRLNDAIWISTPCDFSGELALDIKNLLKVRGFSANITSFNGDYIGYVIPSRYYHLPGYEPRVMSFYGPGVPDYLNELIRGLSLSVVR